MKRGALLFLLGAVAVSGPASAQTNTTPALYRLNPDSSFEQGCFPPCMCPVMITQPVMGTFLLTPTGFDGLFNTYAVTDVNWVVVIGGTATTVSGGGTYRVGGEVALLQELALDLQVGGSKLAHFDSGLVADSVSFPNIAVAISTNGQVCFDTVFDVRASPVPWPELHVALASASTIAVSWAVSATSDSVSLNTG